MIYFQFCSGFWRCIVFILPDFYVNFGRQHLLNHSESSMTRCLHKQFYLGSLIHNERIPTTIGIWYSSSCALYLTFKFLNFQTNGHLDVQALLLNESQPQLLNFMCKLPLKDFVRDKNVHLYFNASIKFIVVHDLPSI